MECLFPMIRFISSFEELVRYGLRDVTGNARLRIITLLSLF